MTKMTRLTNRFSKTALYSVVWAVMMVSTESAWAQQPLDVVLVMDSSGSMKKTDPQELRKPAAKLLLSLLGEGDRASVVSFSDQGYPITFLTPVQGEANQQKLFNAVERISSKGAYTNITGAIQAAQRVHLESPQQDHRRIIILMSDGKMDLESASKDKQATAELIKSLLPQLKTAEIEVHTIAFTDGSDKRLLQSIANQTNGFFNIAKTDKELHGVFTAIFEQSKQPDILPMDGEYFSIDREVKEVTIVASKKSVEDEVVLTTPTGMIYRENSHPSNVKWLKSEQFDLITIQQPVAGEWSLVPAVENNRAYIITDLKLQLQLSNEKPQKDELLSISVNLEEQGKLLNKQAVLSNLKVDLIHDHPLGHSERFILNSGRQDDGALSGIYQIKFPLDDYGRYRIEVNATTGTFERRKSKVIDIIPPMNPEEVLEALETGDESKLMPLPGVEMKAAQHRSLPVSATPHQKAEDAHQVPESSHETEQLETTDHDSGVLLGVVVFFVINGGIILLGGGYFLFRKRKNKQSGATKGDKSKVEKSEKNIEGKEKNAGEDNKPQSKSEAS